MTPRLNRRQFLLSAFGWFPLLRLFRRGRVKLDGVEFRIIRHGGSDRSYLLIHGDEETARQVLIDHMRTHRGVAHLVAGHTRYVAIDRGRVDPNRMFSRVGAEANLKSLDPDWTPERLFRVLNRLDRGRPKLVQALLPPAGGLLIALHNNAHGYSVRDEVPTSDRVSLNQPDDPHAFFLCTAAADFEILARSPYNVVLQNRAPQVDDGSLSRLSARAGVRYANLEVALGQYDQQRQMLAWLETQLP